MIRFEPIERLLDFKEGPFAKETPETKRIILERLMREMSRAPESNKVHIEKIKLMMKGHA